MRRRPTIGTVIRLAAKLISLKLRHAAVNAEIAIRRRLTAG